MIVDFIYHLVFPRPDRLTSDQCDYSLSASEKELIKFTELSRDYFINASKKRKSTEKCCVFQHFQCPLSLYNHLLEGKVQDGIRLFTCKNDLGLNIIHSKVVVN